jgi:hypothetical protein
MPSARSSVRRVSRAVVQQKLASSLGGSGSGSEVAPSRRLQRGSQRKKSDKSKGKAPENVGWQDPPKIPISSMSSSLFSSIVNISSLLDLGAMRALRVLHASFPIRPARLFQVEVKNRKSRHPRSSLLALANRVSTLWVPKLQSQHAVMCPDYFLLP